MSKEKVKIDIGKINGKVETGKDLMKELMRLRESIQVSINPDSDNEHAIIGGQKCQVDDFINKLKKEGLFLKSSTIANPSQIKEPEWIATQGGRIENGGV